MPILCQECKSSSAMPGRRRCSGCQEAHADRERLRQENLLRKGLCRKCAQKQRVEGRAYCSKCLKYYSDRWAQEKAGATKRAPQAADPSTPVDAGRLRATLILEVPRDLADWITRRGGPDWIAAQLEWLRAQPGALP